ncbi:hypothetical protein Agub_g6987 [Astrephomene gubernaculifera]|uniref:Uncharacterized protein n=1 Tax=Astrephomene gubernaculifera TaxID=47775 RepID=A0AAD3HLY1_9CHLO|nr:hypothetical protein Agub_g6987 [Astrephomene gubernaculifera]
MQQPLADDLSSTSFSSTELDVMDTARQEEYLIEKYGRLSLKQRALMGKKQTRRYFDSADWSLQKQGKLEPDVFLGFDCPIDQLPVKSEPTVPGPRQRSAMDHVGWAEPAVLPANAARNVIDI